MELVKARMPAILWVALIALGMILLRQLFNYVSRDPLYLFAPVATGFLIYSIAAGKVWAPALAIAYFGFSFLFVWIGMKDFWMAARVAAADLLFVAPTLIASEYFERSVVDEAGEPAVIEGRGANNAVSGNSDV